MRICMNIGQMFFCATAAISFYKTFTTPAARQTAAPNVKSALSKSSPTSMAERPKNTTGTRSTSASETLNPRGTCPLLCCSGISGCS